MIDYPKHLIAEIQAKGIQGGKECCKYPPNLTYPFEENFARGVIVLKCRVCGVSHTQMYAEPGVYRGR